MGHNSAPLVLLVLLVGMFESSPGCDLGHGTWSCVGVACLRSAFGNHQTGARQFGYYMLFPELLNAPESSLQEIYGCCTQTYSYWHVPANYKSFRIRCLWPDFPSQI